VDVVLTRAADKALRRLPANVERLIRAKIEQLAAEPRALANNVKALKGGEGRMRLRVGDWRVIYRAEARRLVVLDVGPRGDIYE
jgi:mRNA interferase RelE/StbE